eukprot:12612406-Alexandrium_andersonii.AAC.1
MPPSAVSKEVESLIGITEVSLIVCCDHIIFCEAAKRMLCAATDDAAHTVRALFGCPRCVCEAGARRRAASSRRTH